jgi:ORF6N domain
MQMTSAKKRLLPMERIDNRIRIIRGQKVMIDADLTELYGVPTKALNQAVKRNSERFPADFVYQLTAEEKAEAVANCDPLAKLKFSRFLPFAFAEHGKSAMRAAGNLGGRQK